MRPSSGRTRVDSRRGSDQASGGPDLPAGSFAQFRILFLPSKRTASAVFSHPFPFEIGKLARDLPEGLTAPKRTRLTMCPTKAGLVLLGSFAWQVYGAG
jgi:hypothetical protein